MEIKFWAIILGIGLSVTLIAVLVFSPLFDIKNIRVRREDARLDSEEIQHALSGLFHHRLFLVTRKQVEDLLLPNFPDIVEVDIEKRYPSTLEVELGLDPLIANLNIQGEAAPESSASTAGSGAYTYLTAKGYVVESPVTLEQEALPTVKILDWAIRPTHRSLLLTPEFIKTMFDARDEMEKFFGTPVTAMTIYVRADEFHLQNGGTSFWFDAVSPLQEQFDRLRSFLKSTPLSAVKFYVDLRLADKVVFQ